ncbi:unnamed protein product [Spirodela intermedia]|uniref:Uncharacterized protein n=2 Tax=Spirodela intermedia TaxID=51605 RepID=A0A7I8L8K6_SPIIN|nr:unnamed protein product [Spirodela intermedia]CAA6668699.1 unnamed protein product [Spirodela intermedia]CAA7405595.1 unnamed protein product [Spirodela intermedia]
MERATRWDTGIPESELTRLLDHLNVVPDEQPHGRMTSTAADLRDELDQARARVADLEDECELWQKKLGDLYEKALRRRRKEEKLAAMAADLEGELRRERKDRRWLEAENIKLAGEVAAAEASAWRRLQDYEEQKKERELMEEVCRELVEEADGGRAEIEVLKREAMEIRGELDWERRMLQVAEDWREERVQMKLIDAKLAIEVQRSQVSKLRPMLQKFLRGEVVSVAEEEGDDNGDEDDGDSSWEEMLSRSEELDSSIPSIGTEGEVMAER